MEDITNRELKEYIDKRFDEYDGEISSIREESVVFKGGKLHLSKRAIAVIASSLILSVTNFSARAIGTNLRDKVSWIWEDASMNVLDLIRQDFIVIALFLWILGVVLKYYVPKLSNNVIPLILFGVAFLVCSVWGYFTSTYTGNTQYVDAVLYCGIVQGVIVTAIATYGWDVVNGLKKLKGVKK